MVTKSRPESLVALISLYLEGLALRAYSPRTIDNYKSKLERFASWCSDDGLTRAADVQLATFDRYAQHLTRRGHGPSSRKDVLGVLRGFFGWLHRERLILHNPADGLVLRPIRRRLRAPLTHAQVEQLAESIDLTCADGLRDRAVIEVLYSTAMRVSELCALEIYDLDEQRGFILIRCGKGRKDRWVPIGDRALLWVSRYLGQARPELLGAGSTSRLFLRADAHPLARRNVSLRLSQQAIAAGLKQRVSAHALRHSAATEMLLHGASTRVIQELLGHASLASTQRYTHLTASHLQDVHAATHPAEREPGPVEVSSVKQGPPKRIRRA